MAGQISFTLSERDYSAAARAEFLHRMRSPRQWGWLLAVIAAISGYTGYSYAYAFDLETGVYQGAVAAACWLLFALLVLAVCYFVSAKYAGRLFRQQVARPENEMSWTDEGLKSHDELSSFASKWSGFYGWRERRGSYAFYINEVLFYLIPRNVLSPEQAMDLEATLERSGLAKR